MSRPIALYRQLCRAARQLPTVNRQHLVRKRTRHEFEQSRDCSIEEVALLLELGEVQLENILIQAQHLRELQKTGNLKS